MSISMMSDVDEAIWTGSKTLTTSDHLRVVPSRNYYGAVRVEFDYSAPNSTDRNLTMFRLEDENGVEVDGSHPRVSEVGWSRTSAAGSGFFSYTYSHTPYKHLTIPEGMKIIEIMFYPWDSSNGEITVRSLKVSGTAAIEPSKIHYGNVAIKEVYQGSNLVWSSSDDFYLRIEGIGDIRSRTKVAEFSLSDFAFVDLAAKVAHDDLDDSWAGFEDQFPAWEIVNLDSGIVIRRSFLESQAIYPADSIYLRDGSYEVYLVPSARSGDISNGVEWASISKADNPESTSIDYQKGNLDKGVVVEIASISPPGGTTGDYILVAELNGTDGQVNPGNWEYRMPEIKVNGQTIGRIHNGRMVFSAVASGPASITLLGRDYVGRSDANLKGSIWAYPIT